MTSAGAAAPIGAGNGVAEGSWEGLADALAAAALLERPFPDVAPAMSERDAYRLQAQWVGDAFGRHPAGYKAGLTSIAAQARFGIDTAVVGVLHDVERVAPGGRIAVTDGLMIEVEIGFVTGHDGAPAAMMGVVELPRLSYAAPDRLDRNDVIASNVAAFRFVTGNSVLFHPGVRDETVVLERDGEVVNRGTARDALGDPVAAFEWMTHKLRTEGYAVEPGMVMLTGALGRVIDALPGSYVARFEGLGEIEFEIGVD